MKARALFVMSAAIAALASCSSEEQALSTPQEGKGVYLEVTATQPDTPETRMTYEESTGGAHVGMTSMWSPGEQLAVVSYNDDVLHTLKSENGHYLVSEEEEADNTMTFSGRVANESTTGKYNFYYPVADGTIGVIDERINRVTFDYTGQTTTLTHKGSGQWVGDPDEMSSRDVMFTWEAADPADPITLSRGSAILRFVLKLPQGAPPITDIYLSATKEMFPTELELNFSDMDGTLISRSSYVNTIHLGVEGDATDNSARTITAYMLTPEIWWNHDLVKISAVHKDETGGEETVYSRLYTDNLTDEALINYGSTYTFAPADELGEDRFAGSNVYWDGKKLTFDPPYEMRHAAAQGVYFRWGSLVGLSPLSRSVADYSFDIAYKPTYDGDKPADSKWSTATYDWDDIPYENNPEELTTGSAINALSGDAKWADGIGDICQYLSATGAISGNYHMPTEKEFDLRTAYTISGTQAEPLTTYSSDGKTSLVGSLIGVYRQRTAFPYSGRIIPGFDVDGTPIGVVINPGSILYSYYWGSSLYHYDPGWDNYSSLRLEDDDITPATYSVGEGSAPTPAYPIRCIRDIPAAP
jgi:hypothetical protein